MKKTINFDHIQENLTITIFLNIYMANFLTKFERIFSTLRLINTF